MIIAADKDVNAERFNGLPVIEVPVKEAIHHPAELINKVVNGQAPRRQGFSAATDPDEKYERESFGRQIYKHLMSGVSNMLPFVVAGGILIAVSFLWGIYSADPNSPQYNVIAATLMKVGQQAFSIMVPVFTAYIARSISGRPGMVAGFVGGLLANATGAGFLGGIIAGFAAGYFMLLIRHLLDGLPRQYEGLKSIFIMPLIGVPVIGVMMVLLGQPVAAINNGMMNWLSSLQEANPILLGIVVGAMCSFDFGGPVNKAAYVTGTLLLGQGNYFLWPVYLPPASRRRWSSLWRPRSFRKALARRNAPPGWSTISSAVRTLPKVRFPLPPGSAAGDPDDDDRLLNFCGTQLQPAYSGSGTARRLLNPAAGQ